MYGLALACVGLQDPRLTFAWIYPLLITDEMEAFPGSRAAEILTFWPPQAVTKALPLETSASWKVAPDSVQAVSCLVTALNLYNMHGKDFLYESSVEGILHVLKHLGQSPAYLGIVAGGSRPISQASSLAYRI